MTAYDVIGDVHGCADALDALLRKLGYRKRWRTWRHPSRQAVFVGDLIDRGPQQVETVTMVRRMVDAGTAQIAMGNHEFNALAWMTPGPSGTDDFLRTRKGEKGENNRKQHAAFLAQVGENSRRHREFIAWFRTLPMFLDLGSLRVVHACWHDESIAVLRDAEARGGLTDEFLAASCDRKGDGSPEFNAIETVLKGPELRISEPYLDKDGIERDKARIRWWDVEAMPSGQVVEIPPGTKKPDGTLHSGHAEAPSDTVARYRYLDTVPVVFGHYWRKKGNVVTTPTTACVDLSAVRGAARGGRLAAYRFEGEPVIDPSRIIDVAGPVIAGAEH